MVELLRWLTVISLGGGFIVGVLVGNNAVGGDVFSVWAALPVWIGGIVSAVVFAVLAEILHKVREIHTNMYAKKPTE